MGASCQVCQFKKTSLFWRFFDFVFPRLAQKNSAQNDGQLISCFRGEFVDVDGDGVGDWLPSDLFEEGDDGDWDVS